MTADSENATLPDLTQGVGAADLAEGRSLLGRVGEEEVMVARVDGALFAIGARCTHYQGPLAKGLIVGQTVRCPWHHARFCLRTGEAIGAPAIDPVSLWSVEERDGKIFVRAQAEQPKPAPRTSATKGPRRVLIAGGGAAGFAAAEMLRRHGFDGAVTLVSADGEAPYDRPNCSKDYLSGEAPAEWMPLRDPAWYPSNDVDLRLNTEVIALDLGGRTAELKSGDNLPYDALVLATGSEPQRLPIPGFDQPNVYLLRTTKDADAIIKAAEPARRVVVVGASFIGLEVAASLRHRGLAVEIVAPEETPLEKVMGRELGRWIQSLHEQHGVVFHMGRKPTGYADGRLTLDSGEALAADFVVAGTGVRPRTALGERAGLKTDNGILVDRWLRTEAAHVYAVGDIARYPDLHSGQLIRVEHWVHAERQGQHAARAILGDDRAYDDPPFFWSAHYGTSIRYVGHAQGFDPPSVKGSLDGKDAEIRYRKDGRTLAVATIGRDIAALKAELGFEP
jgi:NADPH-dependent 2,4-dienoyl-CoA reductase/sulfur reductase-like enzyme/nitrite reductase/ring-hydroxylating ferredoxin subunit